ncbi:hypothetical protein [Sinorhizobium chiapasense]|uniref:Uncharacterized protein n=1 Tax=Sinorhizobium chiapasense TaxID=501572 RepID=A0ABZ2BHN6_9HYPH
MARPPGERLNGRDTSAVASWGDRDPMRDLLLALTGAVKADRPVRQRMNDQGGGADRHVDLTREVAAGAKSRLLG